MKTTMAIVMLVGFPLAARAQERHENIFGGKLLSTATTSARGEPEIGGAFDVRLERGGHFSEFGVGLTVSLPSAKDGSFYMEAGRSYYLNDGDTGLYLGGGLQLREVGVDGLGVITLGAHVQSGLMFFRDRSTRTYVELRVTQNLVPLAVIDTLQALHPETTPPTPSDAYRTEFGLFVGVGF
ncbi:MAG TPA: hypothetical protein VKN99_06735 [Polyangia bacterium]|nr:hypothetical protein [Polyangia bacterium]